MSLRHADAAAASRDGGGAERVGRGAIAGPGLVAALEAALEATTDGILVAGEDRRVRFVNRRFVELWRLPDVPRHEDVAPVLDSLGGLLEDRRPRVFDAAAPIAEESSQRLRLADGRVFEVDVRKGPEAAEGECRIWCCRDVTPSQRTEARLREWDRWAALGNEVGKALTAEGGPSQFLQGCAQALVRHLGAAFARIWLLDPGARDLVLRASAGMYTNLGGRHARIRMGEAKIGRIAQGRRPHLTNDVPNDPEITDPEWARREGMVAFAGYPMVVEDQLVGVLALFAREELDDSALEALRATSERVGVAVARARAETALRESEARFRLLTEAALEGIIIHDDGAILDANPSFARMLGYAVPEVIGQSVSDVLVLANLTGLDPEERRRYHEQPHELLARRRDGSLLPVEVTARSLTFGGWPLRVTAVRDLTERWRLEQQTRRLEREQAANAEAQAARARAAFLAEASGILGASLDYHTTLAGLAHMTVPALAEACVVDLVVGEREMQRVATAYADAEGARLLRDAAQAGDSPRLAVPTFLRDGRSVLVAHVTRSALRRYGLEAVVPSLPGEVAPRSLISAPLFAMGRLLGALTLIRSAPERRYIAADVTLVEELACRAARAVENAKLFRAADDAIRGREEILHVVAHDLRNPLNTIGLTVDMILGGIVALGDANEQPHLERIKRAVARMTRLIGDLLDVRRIEAGELALDRRREALRPLLEDATELLRPLAAARGLGLALEAADDLPAVEVDGNRVQQVLSNLIGNAIKFTPRGGAIAVAAVRAEAGVLISVADTGPGIPREALPHVFARYWRANRQGGGGIGLGLAIAKAIVEGHGGAIWVESTAGGGTTFHFTLPTERPGTEVVPRPSGGVE